MIKTKIGLFGGTFAPPHMGHVHAAETILGCTELDRLIVMPTAIPPHKVKAGGDTAELRYKMCLAAFGGINKVEVSDYEIAKGGISYTVDTLEYLSSAENEIYLICGTDMFMTLDKWYRAERIFELARIICIPRDDTDLSVIAKKADEYRAKFGSLVVSADVPPVDISSTEIRLKIENGEDYSALVPSEVREIIIKEGLYDKEKTCGK